MSYVVGVLPTGPRAFFSLALTYVLQAYIQHQEKEAAFSRNPDHPAATVVVPLVLISHAASPACGKSSVAENVTTISDNGHSRASTDWAMNSAQPLGFLQKQAHLLQRTRSGEQLYKRVSVGDFQTFRLMSQHASIA